MPFQAVLLDLDGTLVDERSSWEWVHEHYRVDNRDNLRRYLEGQLDDAAFMAADIKLWHAAAGARIHIDDIVQILEAAPIMRGADRLVAGLREASIPTAIVSGGIDLLALRVARTLGIGAVVANSLVIDADGYLTGQGVCRVQLEDKETPSYDALEILGADPGTAAAVGNSRFDAGMFRAAGFGVAFAPVDEDVVTAADAVVKEKDLGLVLPHLVGREPA